MAPSLPSPTLKLNPGTKLNSTTKLQKCLSISPSSSIAKRKGLLAALLLTTCLLLLLVPYLGARSDPQFLGQNVFRNLLFESRYSSTFHRLVGWGDNVLNLTHSFTSEETRNLERVLKAASFRNRTVIITTLNGAWAGPGNMFDLFLESFRAGDGTQQLLQHLVVVALDQVALERCKAIHKHCFVLQTDGVDFSGEKFFMSADYLKMMWRRVAFLRTILEMRYSFLFTDTDILWFRDPFKFLSSEADFQIASDKYNGDPTDLENKPNGGFVYVPANNRTINLYKMWYEARLWYPGKHDQDVFDRVKNTQEFADLGLSIRFLDTNIFSGFCSYSSNFHTISTMHANCCKGLDKKLLDLRSVLDDWKRYKAEKSSRTSRGFKWSIKECRHKSHFIF